MPRNPIVEDPGYGWQPVGGTPYTPPDRPAGGGGPPEIGSIDDLYRYLEQMNAGYANQPVDQGEDYLYPDTTTPSGGLYGDIQNFTGMNDFDWFTGAGAANFYNERDPRLNQANATNWQNYGYGNPSDFDPYKMGWDPTETGTWEDVLNYGYGNPSDFDPYKMGWNPLETSQYQAYQNYGYGNPSDFDPYKMGWNPTETGTWEDLLQYGQRDGKGGPEYKGPSENLINQIRQGNPNEDDLRAQSGRYMVGQSPYEWQQQGALDRLGARTGDESIARELYKQQLGPGAYDTAREGLAGQTADDAFLQSLRNQAGAWAGGPGMYDTQRGQYAQQIGDVGDLQGIGDQAGAWGAGPGQFEGDQRGLVDRMTGGWNPDEASTLDALKRFGSDPGLYDQLREGYYKQWAEGKGGYDDATKQALRQSAVLPIQEQARGIEQAAQRMAASRGNSAGLYGSMAANRLDAANAMARGGNQAQLQIGEAALRDRTAGVEGLGNLQNARDTRQQYSLGSQQSMNAGQRAREQAGASMLGQMQGQADQRRSTGFQTQLAADAAKRGALGQAAGQYGQMQQEADSRRQAGYGTQLSAEQAAKAGYGQAASQYGQLQGDLTQRQQYGTSGLNAANEAERQRQQFQASQFGQMGGAWDARQQYGMGLQNTMNQQDRSRQQQAFQNYQTLQGAQDARSQFALQQQRAMENDTRARQQYAMQQTQGMLNDTRGRQQWSVEQQRAMENDTRARQQAAMQAQERNIERQNANAFQGLGILGNLGQKQTAGDLQRIQMQQQLWNQFQQGAQSLNSLFSALSSLPVGQTGQSGQSGFQVSI